MLRSYNLHHYQPSILIRRNLLHRHQHHADRRNTKSIDQNYELLNRLESFEILECPILAGISRKSMIYKLLKKSAKEALNGTTALHMIALQKGAKILRVHDVAEAVECVQLYEQIQKTS